MLASSLAQSVSQLFALRVVVGAGIGTVLATMAALAAGLYPADRRATGIGWAIGIGRSGAIVGPLMGGYLIAANVALPVLFASYCVPLLLCAACAFTADRLRNRATPDE